MFFKNLFGIFNNLPLILSDSLECKDVSFIRVCGFILLIFIISIYSYVLLIVPQYLDKVNPFITSAFNALLLFIGANILKKGIVVASDYVASKKEETK